MAEDNNTWQEFRGSELGGLLSSLYGAPKVQIDYPKLTKKKFEPTAAFSSSGTKVREVTKRNVSVVVPKVGLGKSGPRPTVAAVDCIARRKQESTIKAELDDIRMRQNYYRPAHKQVIGDHEKERLNQICTYKGGKILPDNLSYPVSETPMEIAAIKKERDRNDQVRRKKAPQRADSMVATRGSVLSDLEQMKEQVASEIDERRIHLENMRTMGMSVGDESRIRGEISLRIAELQELDRNRK